MGNNFGPWYHDRFDPGRIAKDFGDRSYTIAKVTDWAEDNESMARLIAAAPELLEALINLRDNFDYPPAAYEVILNAIAKAEGRES